MGKKLHDDLDFSVTNYDYDSHFPGRERMKMMTILILQLGVELLRNLELWFKPQVKLTYLMMDIGGGNMDRKWSKETQTQGISIFQILLEEFNCHTMLL